MVQEGGSKEDDQHGNVYRTARAKAKRLWLCHGSGGVYLSVAVECVHRHQHFSQRARQSDRCTDTGLRVREYGGPLLLLRSG